MSGNARTRPREREREKRICEIQQTGERERKYKTKQTNNNTDLLLHIILTSLIGTSDLVRDNISSGSEGQADKHDTHTGKGFDGGVDHGEMKREREREREREGREER